jgi:hypothetical protein
MSDQTAPLHRWHAVVESRAPALLDDEVVFRSPAVFAPQEGKLRWNARGKLVSFTVMVRPLRGLQKLVELMAVQLAEGQA